MGYPKYINFKEFKELIEKYESIKIDDIIRADKEYGDYTGECTLFQGEDDEKFWGGDVMCKTTICTDEKWLEFHGVQLLTSKEWDIWDTGEVHDHFPIDSNAETLEKESNGGVEYHVYDYAGVLHRFIVNNDGYPCYYGGVVTVREKEDTDVN